MFWIIPIAVGGVVLGASAVDVTTDYRVAAKERAQAKALVAETAAPQVVVYATLDDCQQAAIQQGLSPSVCVPRQ